MTILGYREKPQRVPSDDNETAYDWDTRSYMFDPIVPTKPGMISTAAMMLCQECRKTIKSMGGPGLRCYCVECYAILKIRDFAEGHSHEVSAIKD